MFGLIIYISLILKGIQICINYDTNYLLNSWNINLDNKWHRKGRVIVSEKAIELADILAESLSFERDLSELRRYPFLHR